MTARPDSAAMQTSDSGSGLAKAIQLGQSLDERDFIILNQADFLSNHLAGAWAVSDYHNALKLGYDVEHLRWPEWVERCVAAGALPRVLSPGQVFASVEPQMAQRYGLAADCQICAGTTDANAAFIATQASRLGDAVTSLGSTLVLKQISVKPVNDSRLGVYSHRLGQRWLVGGASNSGGAVIAAHFSPAEIRYLTTQLKPAI